jgi:hypothetical protein
VANTETLGLRGMSDIDEEIERLKAEEDALEDPHPQYDCDLVARKKDLQLKRLALEKLVGCGLIGAEKKGTLAQLRAVRERVGCGLIDAKRALEWAGGDAEMAGEYFKSNCKTKVVLHLDDASRRRLVAVCAASGVTVEAALRYAAKRVTLDLQRNYRETCEAIAMETDDAG